MSALTRTADALASRTLAEEVRLGLSLQPKELPSKYLYDALGSALFEAICRLPWYPITRAETRLLAKAGRAIVAGLSDPTTIIELGCGSGEKVALLAGYLRALSRSVSVHLIDISSQAIQTSERNLRAFEHVSVMGYRGTYEAGLQWAAARRATLGTILVLFLGSNIGNFDEAAAQEFLTAIRGSLRIGDALLLGSDLVKPTEELLLAYDDPLGVTAAFNKNLLSRINTELGADFDLQAFEHQAVWNAPVSRVEMHLLSRCEQVVRVPDPGFTAHFHEGERIWTESSYKYEPDQIVAKVSSAGFRCRDQWIDPEARFALSLFTAD